MGLSEFPVETLGTALGPCLISTGGITTLLYLESHEEIYASKFEDV